MAYISLVLISVLVTLSAYITIKLCNFLVYRLKKSVKSSKGGVYNGK